jgi:hypothetical protein
LVLRESLCATPRCYTKGSGAAIEY